MASLYGFIPKSPVIEQALGAKKPDIREIDAYVAQLRSVMFGMTHVVTEDIPAWLQGPLDRLIADLGLTKITMQEATSSIT